jgi:hypothetical protein
MYFKSAVMLGVVLMVGYAAPEDLLFPVTGLITAEELCDTTCSCGYSVILPFFPCISLLRKD